jgi:hypothetical protein
MEKAKQSSPAARRAQFLISVFISRGLSQITSVRALLRAAKGQMPRWSRKGNAKSLSEAIPHGLSQMSPLRVRVREQKGQPVPNRADL